ncbi:MAG: glycine--tRNA ligase [Simkania sp.]|nr:glycine--tRNA ligase [Simkania sp.]
MSQPTGQDTTLKHIVALAKRRGFVYPGSEIYGGFANTYSYGPYGAELKKNIRDLWWKRFVHLREDMVGLDGPILLHPRTWEASGHVAGFSDALIDCKQCKARIRADHLLEACLCRNVEGLSVEEMDQLVKEHAISCPKCGARDWTAVRHFNLMFATHLSKTSSTASDDLAYLRPETAQAIFLDFRNIVDTMRVQVPFGVAQIGKAFRNEITPGNFLFRVIEFEQMEIEYFLHPNVWEEHFEKWLNAMQAWCDEIGLSKHRLSLYEHPKEKLSHYSKRTIDVMFDFPFGRSELYGLAYRTDFDLKRHSEFAKVNLEYTDPKTQEKYLPHVIEPTFGLDRTFLAILCDAYALETLDNGDTRTVLRLSPKIAPVKAAVFPLMKKEPLVAKARPIFEQLRQRWAIDYDDSGAIGKRYRRHDEIGTPLCITIDFQTLEDDTVTIRHRDSMQQERIASSMLIPKILEALTS